MPCIWSRHNTSQLFITVAIIPANSIGGVISVPINPCMAVALVDTGATTTGLSHACANRAQLSPVGKIPIHGVGGTVHQNSYLFHLGFPLALPPGVLIPGVPAPSPGQQAIQLSVLEKVIQGCEFHAPPNFEVLLGMDVISTGTLVVQGDGNFSFSF
jgi:Ni,Fe-hydrogenase III small subunit